MPKTVVHLIAGLGLGGAERQLLYLVQNSHAENVRHAVISMTDAGVLGDAFEQVGVSVYCLDMPRGRISLGGLFRLRSMLKKMRPDVLQTWMYHAGLLGFVTGGLTSVPSIFWNLRCSNMDLGDYGRLTALVVKLCAWVSRWVPVVVVNSQAGLDWHEKLGYHPKSWRLINNGFDLDRFAPKTDAKQILCDALRIDSSARLVGLVARFDPMKDHANFLAAAGKVAISHPDVHFIMVGKDVDEANPVLVHGVRANDIAGRVHLLGARQDIPDVTAAFDVAVSSSSYGEGFPNTVGEAMACGVPCVVTDVGDSAAIVDGYGWVVPPRDAKALAKGMRAALDMRADESASRSQAVRDRIMKLYGLDTMATAYHDLYATLSVRTQNQKAG